MDPIVVSFVAAATSVVSLLVALLKGKSPPAQAAPPPAPHLLGALPSGNGQTTSAKSMSVVMASDAPGGGTAQAAGADGVTNPTAGTTFVDINGFNGTTWDRIRTAVTTVSATLTGFLNTLPWALYHSSPVTRTNGQGGPLETDASGNLRGAEQFAAGAEDNVVGVFKVEQRFSYARIVTATTTQVKTGAGMLHAIVVNTPVASATIEIDDATSHTTPIIGIITCGGTLASDQVGTYIYDCTFATGLSITTSSTADITVIWR